MENRIKYLRVKENYTQSELAAKTGLSLRTIQRVESNQVEVTGHTLTALSTFFNIEPSQINSKVNQTIINIRLINLSTLLFIFLPIVHLILPILLWRKYRKLNPVIDEAGKQIINFQILWSIASLLLIIFAPFIEHIFIDYVSIIFLVIALSILSNLFWIARSALFINKEKYQKFSIALRLI
ncbi:helix-turn-helix domain-containing protein [Roseivirga echinicomitans]|uniref:HTH cro/C1-type domain-containing protein n=1 Tax=Roseivirga echinicomitans TaxID=296218 RepID=A0A150X2V6_9BACT|nr:helix-turn-helix domain-containing protein [Roseivirga echinicomitans]KYG73058.1 hypothetical protein AWN68_10225 [Roseivirga echinicomitans]